MYKRIRLSPECCAPARATELLRERAPTPALQDVGLRLWSGQLGGPSDAAPASGAENVVKAESGSVPDPLILRHIFALYSGTAHSFAAFFLFKLVIFAIDCIAMHNHA